MALIPLLDTEAMCRISGIFDDEEVRVIALRARGITEHDVCPPCWFQRRCWDVSLEVRVILRDGPVAGRSLFYTKALSTTPPGDYQRQIASKDRKEYVHNPSR